MSIVRSPRLILISVVACALAPGLAACVEQPGADPDPGADSADLLPDGTTGVDRVHWRDQDIDVAWTARAGLKWASDDFAIGPAIDERLSQWSALNVDFTPWTNDHMAYCVWRADQTPFGLSTTEEQTVDDALTALAAITPLHFDKFDCLSSSPPARYTDYIHCNGCSSAFTQKSTGHSGEQIQLTGFSQRTIWHETGHALGFEHEQQRYDRNSYVNIYTACSDGSVGAGNWTKDGDPATDALTPYDVTSVMQYPSNTASKDDPACPTLLYTGGGAPYYGSYTGVGAMYGVYFNKSTEDSLEDINAIYQVYEPKLGACEQNDMLGGAMVSADFDGDGYDDLAVGAMGENIGSGPSSGAVFLYKGTMNGLVAWKVLKESDFAGATARTADGFGVALAAADADGDGDAELFVGAQMYGSSRGGAVFVYRGGRGGPQALGTGGIVTQSNSGAGTSESSDLFGAALATGHLDGGSTLYVAVGAPYEGLSNGSAHGVVSVFKWNSGLAFVQNVTAGGYQAHGDMFGSAIAIGDLDGGHIDDLIVGAPQDGVGTGEAFLFWGHSTGTLTSGPRVTGPSPATDDRFGAAVAYGKPDGAGTPAAVIGAPGRANATGRAYKFTWVSAWGLFYEYAELKQSDIAGETGHAGDSFGAQIAVGRVDGDSNDDVVVTVPNKLEGSLQGAGAVDLFLSSSADKAMTAGTPQSEDRYGASVAIGNFDRGARSVKGNGSPDLAIGMSGRTCGTAGNAGVFNVYQGTSQSFWRQFDETTHQGP